MYSYSIKNHIVLRQKKKSAVNPQLFIYTFLNKKQFVEKIFLKEINEEIKKLKENGIDNIRVTVKK